VLIGLQLFDGDRASNRRQKLAVEALLGLKGVVPVNLQFRVGTVCEHAGVETAAVLVDDSVRTTMAAPGTVRRKPIAREIFDVLASLAGARGFEYFACINADILVTPDALASIAENRCQTYAISRADVGDAARPEAPKLLTAGQDMFVVRVEWWRLNRWRFRPYIMGEMCWDVVYTATMMCHSNGMLLNREPLIVHERHAPAWHEVTPAARFNGMLAALDARYFSIWCRYWAALEAARARRASAEEELQLRHEYLAWRRSAPEAVRQAARTVKARVTYHRLKRSWVPAA